MKILILLTLLSCGQSYALCDQKTAESKAIASLKDFSGKKNITHLQIGTSFNEKKDMDVILLMSLQKEPKGKSTTFISSVTYGSANCEVLHSSSGLIQSTVNLDKIP